VVAARAGSATNGSWWWDDIARPRDAAILAGLRGHVPQSPAAVSGQPAAAQSLVDQRNHIRALRAGKLKV
jgi:hypothetical protein